MADTKISALTSAGALDGTEIVPVVRPGANYRTTTADIAALAQAWALNWTDDGDVYVPADQPMTIDQGNAAIGTATITFEKSTAADPDTFSSTTLPITLENGAWLKVSAVSVTGFAATHLKRIA
jgi:hypothetical protein